SFLFGKYSQMIDAPSAKEKLAELISEQQVAKQQTSQKENNSSVLNSLSKNTLFRQVVRQVFRELTRAILSLFKSKRN
ncbi:helicase HerA-like domain-containing protein, partial [Legionella pneumophila]